MVQKERNEYLSEPSVGELSDECIKAIIDICEITAPKSILELGFNRGVSALMWLKSSKAIIKSVDWRKIDKVEKSINYINTNYPNRFTYKELNHSKILDEKEGLYNLGENYDLVFIDGDHSVKAVDRDAKNSLEFNPQYLVFDDYKHRHHQAAIENAIKSNPLEIIKEYDIWSGIVLCKNLNFK
jgi:hypothetical protein|tara:strand:+ start:732 stop:1283 length:552 start_codon:yes stop_codon:yes gene_type:complete